MKNKVLKLLKLLKPIDINTIDIDNGSFVSAFSIFLTTYFMLFFAFWILIESFIASKLEPEAIRSVIIAITVYIVPTVIMNVKNTK